MKTYHLLGKSPYFTNCFLITDNVGNAVLIDCSAPIENVKAILENDQVQLKAIILTHGHEDHRETLQEIATTFDVPVYIGAQDALQFGLENTFPLCDMQKIEFGQIKLLCLATPGHTPGGFSLLYEDMLFSGDTLFAGTIGRTDLEGGDFDVLMQSLKKLLQEVKSNPKVLPGHNHFSTFGQEKVQNPYLKQALN